MDFKHIIEFFKHKPFFRYGTGLCRVYEALFFVCLTIGKNCDTIQVSVTGLEPVTSTKQNFA